MKSDVIPSKQSASKVSRLFYDCFQMRIGKAMCLFPSQLMALNESLSMKRNGAKLGKLRFHKFEDRQKQLKEYCIKI
ncbi:hypothetical protein BCT49_17610 [Vibrio lentus]|uniref:Uncharacterized protein n=1 Tax=Vibrio lentus TaxID=136468 RepID=A0A2N7JVD5_9VIBR|nr:hypothetical protein BCT49_17610 [Vibrio lentus]